MNESRHRAGRIPDILIYQTREKTDPVTCAALLVFILARVLWFAGKGWILRLDRKFGTCFHLQEILVNGSVFQLHGMVWLAFHYSRFFIGVHCFSTPLARTPNVSRWMDSGVG